VKVGSLVGRGAAVLSAGALATAGLVFAVSGSAGAASVEKSWDKEGEASWTVPAGICSVWVEVAGAQGGDARSTDNETGQSSSNPGGLGGVAKAHLAVTPGESLDINVGGRGEDSVDGLSGHGGENGGGDGGSGVSTDSDEGGAGGGGASDIRQGGTGVDARVVVGGGGGGAGGGEVGDTDPPGGGGPGGDGGGEEGKDGQPSVGSPETQAGEGASQDDGGNGGVTTDPGEAGEDGSKAEGGAGGNANGFAGDGGGGGGGGLYGGGGGAASQSDGAFVDGAGGGGGSGFGPDGTTFDSGEQKGDGEVTISYDPVADACAAAAVVAEPKFTG
jgi:hypothetical protein